MPDESNTPAKKKAETARWTAVDEATLIATLVIEKARANWADNNPKPTAFAACVKALEDSASGGAPKGTAVVKARWQKVTSMYLSRLGTLSYSEAAQNRGQRGCRYASRSFPVQLLYSLQGQ
jgi:hypothetical protein